MEVYVPDYYKISGISNKMFTQTVRELKRRPYFQKNFPVVPPKVEYKLSERGRSLEIFYEVGSVGR
jgi:DNA-binding HxlR family transcriptional regulator